MDDDELRRAADEGRHLAEALDALRAWLLIEDAHERGGVPDEVVHFIQDHVGRLLGPRAQEVGHGFLRGRLDAGATLPGLARDRAVLLDLLAAIEGTPRRNLEPRYQWVVGRPATGDPRALP